MAQHIQLKNPQLVGIAGPLKGKKFPLKNQFVGLGSAKTNDIVVPGQKVSEHHATLFLNESSQWVVQNKSETGVLVNKNPVNEKVLVPGDTIQIGELTLFRYEAKYIKSSKRIAASSENKIRIKPGIAIALGIYLLLIIAAGLYFASDNSAHDAGGLTHEYVDEAIEKTRAELMEQKTGNFSSGTHLTELDNLYSDPASYYFSIVNSADPQIKQRQFELLSDQLRRLFFTAWNLEQQGRYKEALQVYERIENMVPDTAMPVTRVARWRISALQKKVSK